MEPGREYEILSRLYDGDGDVWLMGPLRAFDFNGVEVMTRRPVRASMTATVLNEEEARDLKGRKLLTMTVWGEQIQPTAEGREYWKKLKNITDKLKRTRDLADRIIEMSEVEFAGPVGDLKAYSQVLGITKRIKAGEISPNEFNQSDLAAIARVMKSSLTPPETGE